MSWLQFLSAALGSSVPALLVAIYFNRSLERLKVNLQQDVFKFSQWHQRRIEAAIAIYDAFDTHLDFLRKQLYREGVKDPIDEIHDFPKKLRKQIMFLDDELAETVLGFQAILFSFWNETVANGEIGSDETRYQLDYKLPAILPKLRRAINERMDPDFAKKNGLEANSILRLLESGGPNPTSD